MGIFQEAQEVTLYSKGAGVISHEVAVITTIDEEGYIYLDESNKRFLPNGKWDEEDPFFGFDFWIEEKSAS